ncbi:hypothetical protein U6A24_20225 [Aquimarina gracilis]|uniref:Uncharacterized protein n=1 Tax=Aquimarina gracilis TaxID=874422 RepID=A0ABU6A0X4_9FLAO|nr:hypothetical protein [Aquimarina gracilis]MEB3347815.1 hypothetical protein [Aquimarina gracilis]
MKKGGNFIGVVGVASFMFCIASCEQPDGGTDFINTNEQAGFMSTTGNSNQILENKFEAQLPLLHMKLNGDLSEEEAAARFDEVVAEYMKNNEKSDKAVSTEWYYRIATLTGTQAGNGTDGNVRASVYFYTDKGAHNAKNIVLDYPDIDERELGKWDYYLFKTAFPNQAVSWVKVGASNIQLQGTDAWFVKQFHTYMVTSDQTVPASGTTNIYTFPNVWLDNNCADCWDTYQRRGGYGKLEF